MLNKNLVKPLEAGRDLFWSVNGGHCVGAYICYKILSILDIVFVIVVFQLVVLLWILLLFCCFSWSGGSTYMLTPDAYLCYILQVPGKLLRSWCQCSHLDWNNNYVCKSCQSVLNVWVISFTTFLINVIFTFTLLTSTVGVFTNLFQALIPIGNTVLFNVTVNLMK